MKRFVTIFVILSIIFLTFSLYAAAPAANTCTSKTGTVTGTDPNFVLTYRPAAGMGSVLYIKYTKGTETGITLTFDTVNASLSTTDKYRYPVLSGTALSAYTMVITATGNYRIPLPLISTENRIVANITFGSATQDGVVVANFMEP